MNLRNYSLSVAVLLFFISGACVAQSAFPQLPDTPAANQAKGWLEVFNAGDVEKRRAFLQKNYPSRLERFDRETEMRRATGTRCFGHGGGAPGMNGELKICPGPGYVVAVLANLDPSAATRVADFITNRLPIK